MSITKATRVAVYNKYNGHCAYCGKEIEYKDMQVDHVIPQCRAVYSHDDRVKDGIDDFNNLMPSCRRCNHYKRANSLEYFRHLVEGIPSRLERDNYIFKVGIDYGFFNSENREVKFYFEQCDSNASNEVD